MKHYEKISGWGRYPIVKAEVLQAADRDTVRQHVLENERIIARGNGKSYGDASLGQTVLSTLALNHIIRFDPLNGLIECESGVLLSDLLPLIIAAGWFFHVTPGIKSITVGGAVASDVHGKNHPLKGCFSNWLLSFELMTATGEILTCSREENTTLFWQTCGGMGWTGVILSARFQLMRIEGTAMRQKTLRCNNLQEIFEAMTQNHPWSYAAAWIDTSASGRGFGRGVVHLAEHVATPAPLRWEHKKATNIPFVAPFNLITPLAVKSYNALYFHKNPSSERVVSMDQYFYPLDAIRNWNRLYGPRGFVQYQCCIPEENAVAGIQKLLHLVRNSPERPFVPVLKRHGERPPEAIHSFPIKGYSLALDFPRMQGIFELVKKLDALVWELGGKIYLTKDSCSAARMGRVEASGFGDGKFWSGLRGRVSG